MATQRTEKKRNSRIINDEASKREATAPDRTAAQAAESAHRFYKYQVPRPAKKVELHDEELPANYDQTRLTLMARDPNNIHAYWEIAPGDIDALRNRLGPEFDRSNYALRMYDISQIDFNGHNANHHFDIDIAPHMNNWYLNLWCDNGSYCGQIGMRTPSGDFHPVTQSNVAMTPRANASGRSDMIWMDVKDNREEAFIFTWPRAKRVAKALDSDQAKQIDRFSRARRIYITEDDIRAYYASLYPLLRRVRNFRRWPKDQLGREGDVLDQFADRERIEDLTIPGISKSEYYRKLLAGASAELFEKGGASEQVFSPGASSQLQAKQRQFFFELWTELIVYGRTEPNAEVIMNGKHKVDLRPDGTFTLRYALPDGEIPLDFTATSFDRIETRRIATAVQRARTTYD